MDKMVLIMQDVSCVGQCSVTVALPILSHYGFESAILPTALLSNHTAFKEWTCLDLTSEMSTIYEGWAKNDFKYDAFLLGYLGDTRIIDLAKECFARFSRESALKIVDPAFGDNSKLYGAFDMTYVEAMRNLIGCADIIVPNFTETCFLTGCEYKQSYDKAYFEQVVRKLQQLTNGVIVVTGVEFGDGQIGEAVLKDGKFEYTFGPKLPRSSHGTGDVFAAVFASHLLNGVDYIDACALAGKFVADSILATPAEHSYGVCFEKVLYQETK